MQLFYFVRMQVLALDDALWQSEAGFLDVPSLETIILTTKRILANPALRAAWDTLKPQIAPSLRERIEQIAAETPLAQPTDWAVAWRNAYRALTANLP